MLVLGSRFNHTPVISLQTGTQLALTSRPIIDPRNLTIVAYEVDGPLLVQRPSFLRTNEIREMSPIGMIVDSSDDLIALDDVISLKKIHDFGFDLIGYNVIDEHKHKLGKVEDYTLETGGFVIQQISVKRTFFRSLTDTSLLIGRSQIVEVNDTTIIVKSTAKKEVEPVMETVRQEYVNPFRHPAPQPEQTDN